MPTPGRHAVFPSPGWEPRIVQPSGEAVASAAWRGALARLNVPDEFGTILAAGELGECPFPIPVTFVPRRYDDLAGTIDEMWIEPGEPSVLCGRGRAAGALAQAITARHRVTVGLELHDGGTCYDVHAHIRYGWGVWRATAELGGETNSFGTIAAEDDYEHPVPVSTDGGPLAMPRRLRHVPAPMLGEDLTGWVARVAGTFGITRRHAMDVLGLEPGTDPEQRLRRLTPGRLYEETVQRFAAATGFAPNALVGMVQAAAELRRLDRAGTPQIKAARAQLTELLKASMQDSCVPGADGYGGSMSVVAARLSPAAIEELRGGMRRAGRQLGWKTETFAYPLADRTCVSVTDRRDIPESVAAMVERARYQMMRKAVDAAEARRGNNEPPASGPIAAECERADRFPLEVEVLLTAILGDPRTPAEPGTS